VAIMPKRQPLPAFVAGRTAERLAQITATQIAESGVD